MLDFLPIQPGVVCKVLLIKKYVIWEYMGKSGHLRTCTYIVNLLSLRVFCGGFRCLFEIFEIPLKNILNRFFAFVFTFVLALSLNGVMSRINILSMIIDINKRDM